MLICLFLSIFLQSVHTANDYDTAAPVWLTSQFFRAGNQNVINTRTGNASTPQYTFLFSSALPGVPKLAYGIKNYRGDDYFGQQRFQIRRIQVTASTFRVAVQIFGVTNIHILNVPYIAIDPTFPHHLNSFDNVPINYNNGDLTNITAKSTTQVLSYTNIVNYTQQAEGMIYTRFKPPLTNNRILLYIMALNIFSTNERSQPFYPIDLHVTATVLTEQTYEFKVTLSTNVMITLIHFSQIMIDQADVQSSKKYYIITEYYDLPTEGGFIQLPQQFVDNFILGLTDFSTARGKAVLNYNWKFTTIDGVFGVLVQQSIPIDPSRLSTYALTRQGTMVFYMKTWQCPSGFDFFNLTTNLCQDMCGDYTFEQMNEYQCEYCNYSCLDCTSGHDCLSCSGNLDNRVLTGDKACTCLPGYYEIGDSTICQSCEDLIPSCIDCFFNDTYKEEDAPAGAVEIGCFKCIPGKFLANNMCEDFLDCSGATVLNYETNTCDQCPIQSCTDCISMTECAACNASQQKYLNQQTMKCESCTVSFCQECSSIETCSGCKETFILLYNYCICPQFHYLDKQDESCLKCSPYCKTCKGESPYQCLSCYYDQKRVLIGGACICDDYNYMEPDPGAQTLECQKRDLTKCDRGFVYISQSNVCVELCGDGMVVDMQCDDGNIMNGDGCSDKCEIEDKFVCSKEKGEISVCKLQTIVSLESITVTKDQKKNSLNFVIDLNPQTNAYQEYNLTEMLEFEGADIDITNAYYENGMLIISTNYHEDLVDEQISLKVHPDFYFSPDTPPYPEDVYSTSKATFQLGQPTESLTIKVASNSEYFYFKTANNLDPYFYTQEQYEAYGLSKQLMTGSTVIGLVAGGVTLFLKNGLSTIIIISSLQICFLGLISVEGLNPVSQAIKESKFILGYNEAEIIENEETKKELSHKIKSLGFTENLQDNFNVMLFCCYGFLAFVLFFYIASLKNSTMKIAHKIAQKQAMLFIFFNLTNGFFCLSILTSDTLVNILFAIATCALFGYQIIHFAVFAKDYYGVGNTFNLENSHFRIFLGTIIVARFSACLMLTYIPEPQFAAVGASVAGAIFIIFLLILRPFAHLANTILVAVGEGMSCGFLASIYAMEGLKSSEWLNGWVMIGLMCGISAVGVANIGFSIYTDCKYVVKKPAKIFIEPDDYP